MQNESFSAAVSGGAGVADDNSAMTATLEEHFGYLSDKVKLAQYQKSISASVQPHHVVLDLGCGSGLLGLMALRAGAKKVLFLEQHLAGIHLENLRRTSKGAPGAISAREGATTFIV